MHRAGIHQSILSLCLLSCGYPLAAAQISRDPVVGTIAGTVEDPLEAGIPGVQATLTEDVTQKRYETTTDCSGLYQLSGLEPGKYSQRTAPGWPPALESGR